MRIALCSAVVAFAVALPASASVLPSSRTPVAKLAPAGIAHHEVLKIDQDFHPNDDYEIALDAWVDETRPDAIAEVRMWWLDTATKNERSPFGKGVRRHIGIDYDAVDTGHWAVRIEQGRKEFRFDVELGGDGSIDAYADIETARRTIDHCRVVSSRLVATKILGIPAGLNRLDVTCVDDSGARHRGRVRARRSR